MVTSKVSIGSLQIFDLTTIDVRKNAILILDLDRVATLPTID